MHMVRPGREDSFGSVAQDIQFSIIECVKLITAPRPQVGPPHGTLRTPHSGWKIDTTWKWILQTILALKSLTTHYRLSNTGFNIGTGLHTLHHLMMIETHLTTQEKENAWLLLGQGEIPDLYAHLICAQLQDTDTNAAVGMAAVLEGHTQAVSRISRDRSANDEVIHLCLSLLDMMCPRGWIRDKEATDDITEPRAYNYQGTRNAQNTPTRARTLIAFQRGRARPRDRHC